MSVRRNRWVSRQRSVFVTYEEKRTSNSKSSKKTKLSRKMTCRAVREYTDKVDSVVKDKSDEIMLE